MEENSNESNENKADKNNSNENKNRESEEIIKFDDVIKTIDDDLKAILDCFNRIGDVDFEENETFYCENVGNFSKHLKDLLDTYFKFDLSISRTFKPLILYYRQVQGYLIFLVRFLEILKVKDHDEILQAKNFILQKDQLIKKIYNDLADQQTELFEGDFRKYLNDKLSRRFL